MPRRWLTQWLRRHFGTAARSPLRARPQVVPLEARWVPARFAPAANFNVGDSPRAVVVADVNRDGRPDLATANSGSGTVSVLLGNANGTFQSAQDFNVGVQLFGVAVADVNGDGRPDLVTANRSNSTAGVLLGN